jgi:hypothetical protein
MKLLSTFEDLSAVTASGSTANFPAANVDDENPGLYWRADAYGTDAWLKIDFTSAKSLTCVFLNQANFPQCKIQGNAADSWASPSFDETVDLVQDEAGNRKGWFDLTAFNYRYLRILIPSGQALDSDTVPILGNLITGTSAALPIVSQFTPELIGRMEEFESDGGNYDAEPIGIQRHILSLTFGDTLADLKAVPKTWQYAVLFEDLSDASGAWLIVRPTRWPRPTRNANDAKMSVQFKERT